MLFEYAVHKDTSEIVHVDSVPNGKRCNCVCKNCGDNLVAKNNGKIIQHHFSHTTKEESRDCQMTQLHIAMQLHFVSLSEITFPGGEIEIGDKVLITPELTMSVKNSVLEYRLGSYLADIYMNTDVIEVAIEVCVTHKCDEEKRQYYIENQIDSIEYDFPLRDGNSISEWISRVKNNAVEYRWIYYSVLEEKKISYLEEIELNKKKKKSERESKSLRAMEKSLSSKKIYLPAIYENMKYIYGDSSYDENVLIYPKRNKSCENIYISLRTDDYIVIEGVIKNRVISAIYSFSDDIPELGYQDDRSIVCRHYTSGSNKKSWLWVKHPAITKRINEKYIEFKADCQDSYRKNQSIIRLKNKIKDLSNNYWDNREVYFKRDYNKWSKWIIKNKLFTPSPCKSSPPYPDILKTKREFGMLWPFQTWHIMVLSRLAEIIDGYPVGQKIYYLGLFLALEKTFGLSRDYREVLSDINGLEQLITFDELIDLNGLIKEALSPYTNMSIISVHKDYLIRKGSLILALII